MGEELVIAMVGNPNCGKTSLFNVLTGSNQHVGNWPGVTVEKKEGKLKFENKKIKVVDLPGTYSLGAYSEDEVVARNFILEDKPDIVINVVDATNLERNLYLTAQLIEMNANVIIALNMMDEANNKKIDINIKKISSELGVPIVPTIAPKKGGIKELIKTAVELSNRKKEKEVDINYGKEIQKEVSMLESAMGECSATLDYPSGWTAIKLLENDTYVLDKIKENPKFKKVVQQLKNSTEKLTSLIGYEPESYIIDKRYEFIGEITKNNIKRGQINEESISDKIDKVITNRWLGIPIFAITMFLLYQITIKFGQDYLGAFIEDGFAALGVWAEGAMANSPELLRSFVIDGIIGGLGAVLVFVPLIFVMYFLISLLEDSGYMARAAYVMDRFMNSIGLHGKTAVSFIIGSGCNVAGIMSTRTLESKKDRMIGILINPFISCGARLPVYAVFAGAFFADKKVGIFSGAGIVVFSLYVIGIIVAILMGKLFSKYLFKGESSYFVMELPPYRVPTVRSVFTHMWEKSEAFVRKAGTIIFGIILLVWVLSVMPYGVEPGSKESILGMIGSFFAPLFKPAGFGEWQAVVALITGVGAKEAVVGTLATVYGVAEEGLTEAVRSHFTALSAYSFMIMTLLYMPCCAAIATIKRETNSAKWAWFTVLYTSVLGWGAAVLVYQIGTLLGLG